MGTACRYLPSNEIHVKMETLFMMYLLPQKGITDLPLFYKSLFQASGAQKVIRESKFANLLGPNNSWMKIRVYGNPGVDLTFLNSLEEKSLVAVGFEPTELGSPAVLAQSSARCGSQHRARTVPRIMIPLISITYNKPPHSTVRTLAR